MKTMVPIHPVRWIVVLLFLIAARLGAAEDTTIERVLKQDGKILIQRNGKTEEMGKAVALANHVAVATNGTFKVDGGKERKLQEGQAISRDGSLISSDGSVVPVVNHLIMQRGQVIVVIDGDAAPLSGNMAFPNGGVITGDGSFTGPDGRTIRLLDGQVFRMNGSPLAAKDTVTLRGGRVMVQKDGSLLSVAPTSSLMMNDGTKVLGEGALIKPDGERMALQEGEVVVIPGVVTRGP
jgi:hypothetical protein